MGEKIKIALRTAGATIGGITASGHPDRLVSHIALQAYRRADPEIDTLVRGIIATSHTRAMERRRLRVRNETAREQTNDYFKIRAMLPANFPDKDEVIGDIFEALLDGRLRREDVRARVGQFIAAQNQDARKYRVGKYGLRSLDAPIFVDNSASLLDTISRGLWD
jgi:hypothetical protein